MTDSEPVRWYKETRTRDWCRHITSAALWLRYSLMVNQDKRPPLDKGGLEGGLEGRDKLNPDMTLFVEE